MAENKSGLDLGAATQPFESSRSRSQSSGSPPPIPPKPTSCHRGHWSTNLGPPRKRGNAEAQKQRKSEPEALLTDERIRDYEREMQVISKFMEIAEAVCNRLQRFHTKYGECIVTERLWQAIEKTKHILQDKEICITVFGQHNCGKSTFLNALVGEEILPVLSMSETSIKVKIQHDVSIHTGVCPPDCSLRDDKCCPQLVVMKGKEDVAEVIYGPHEIYSFLRRRNKEVRKAHATASVNLLTVILKLNIPLLSGSIPPGWTVSIMDNPGFGEAKEHITQLAEASMVTSSAYIYLMQTENVEGREAADFFTELVRTDKGAIVDGRLTIGVTKFDLNYEDIAMKTTGSVTVEMVKKRIIDSAKEVNGITLSGQMIIPICGRWALAGSKLANCLKAGSKNEKEKRYNEAALVLWKCPLLSLPGGQGQSYDDAIIRSLYTPVKLVQKLESLSGMTDLKARIGYVVGSACVKVWATKIHTQLQTILDDVKKILEESLAKKESKHQSKSSSHSNSSKLLKEIVDVRQAIVKTLDRGSDRFQLEVWTNFQQSYAQDLKGDEPQEAGKGLVRALIIEFRDECKTKIENKQLGPTEFEESLKEFLKANERKLQKSIDKACNFRHSHTLLRKEIGGVIRRVSSIKRLADKLLKAPPTVNSSPADTNERTEDIYPSTGDIRDIMDSTPKLGDIRFQVSIPQVSLPWWKRLVDFLRSRGWLRQVDSSLTDPPSEDQSSSSDECTSEAQARATPSESDQLAIIEGFKAVFYGHDANDAPLLDGRDKKSEELSDKELPPNPTVCYEKWTSKLEAAVIIVQKLMEAACEQYFRDIEQRAIDYFYRDYYLETKKQVDEFDDEFRELLRAKKGAIERLKKEVDMMTKELQELKKSRNTLEGCKTKLHEAYTPFAHDQEQEEHMHRELA